MKELKGTEKQVAWAMKIRENILAKANEELTRRKELIERRKANGQPTPEAKVREYLGQVEAVIERVMWEDNAAWFIENRDVSMYDLPNK